SSAAQLRRLAARTTIVAPAGRLSQWSPQPGGACVMARKVLIGGQLVVIGALAAALVMSGGGPAARVQARTTTANFAPARGFDAVGTRADGDGFQSDIARRLALMSARVAEEAAERRRLEERLDAVAAQLAALRGSAGAPASAPPTPGSAG